MRSHSDPAADLYTILPGRSPRTAARSRWKNPHWSTRWWAGVAGRRRVPARALITIWPEPREARRDRPAVRGRPRPRGMSWQPRRSPSAARRRRRGRVAWPFAFARARPSRSRLSERESRTRIELLERRDAAYAALRDLEQDRPHRQGHRRRLRGGAGGAAARGPRRRCGCSMRWSNHLDSTDDTAQREASP